VAGAQWGPGGTPRITIGAIALFVLATLLSSGVYQATTSGLALAVIGVLAHAIAALLRRGVVHSGPPVQPPQLSIRTDATNGLSSREVEVLRELVRGRRNSDIAATLGITERTVKSHLKSIYQKFGVESRAAAVATAVQRGLV
jgi:DNA-binding NarL/FixJ family response regulator